MRDLIRPLLTSYIPPEGGGGGGPAGGGGGGGGGPAGGGGGGGGGGAQAAQGVFVTADTVWSFPITTGAVIGLWKLLAVVFPTVLGGLFTTPGFGLLLAILAGVLLAYASWPTTGTRRQYVTAFMVGVANTVYIGLAVLGIPAEWEAATKA